MFNKEKLKSNPQNINPNYHAVSNVTQANEIYKLKKHKRGMQLTNQNEMKDAIFDGRKTSIQSNAAQNINMKKKNLFKSNFGAERVKIFSKKTVHNTNNLQKINAILSSSKFYKSNDTVCSTFYKYL